MPPLLGTWMSSMILTPLAIMLTYRAINDIGGMISFDFSRIQDFLPTYLLLKQKKRDNLPLL